MMKNEPQLFLLKRYYSVLENIRVMSEFYNSVGNIVAVNKYVDIWRVLADDLLMLEHSLSEKEVKTLEGHIAKHPIHSDES